MTIHTAPLIIRCFRRTFESGKYIRNVYQSFTNRLLKLAGKMEESASLSELADIAFEWMEMSIPPETPSTPSSLEDSVQSPACSGSPSTTDTESSQYSGEWEEAPKKPARYSRYSRYSRSSKPSEPPAAGLKASGRGRGRRTRIPPEDRLLRKKEQNKTAATRYRYDCNYIFLSPEKHLQPKHSRRTEKALAININCYDVVMLLLMAGEGADSLGGREGDPFDSDLKSGDRHGMLADAT